ncbi:MAG: CDP-alcohol phosphatidyltransferase family protein [Actinomycetota bacterium]|nr:CDP-alcohol phosphatidyltransferase family protein [Actinomycetota bacterium]
MPSAPEPGPSEAGLPAGEAGQGPPDVKAEPAPPAAEAGPAAPAETEQAAPDRVLTVPNALSLVRLACVPLFLWLLFGRNNPDGAAWLLAVLGATDWVDGYIARRFNQVSTVGKILDPAADRILLIVGIFAILDYGAVPAWLAWVVIAREVIVGAGVLVLAGLGARRVDVQWIGKCGAFALMVAFPLFLVSDSGVFWADQARFVAWPVALLGLVFTYWSAVMYVPLGRAALAQARAEKAADEGRVGSAG